MANLVLNIALGSVTEFYNRVDQNDPANCAFLVIVWNSTATDATLRDLDTIAAFESDANTAEVTNTNYARKTITDTDLTAFAPNDTDDRVDLDIPDQTWTGVAAGSAWTDLMIAWDSDTTAGTDSTTRPTAGYIIPCTWHDFAVTPDGSDITAQIAAAGFFRASQAP